MREGSRVATFDIREPRWDIGDALFLKVDVSNPLQIWGAIDLLFKVREDRCASKQRWNRELCLDP
jgi:hypothetical protein